MDYKNKAISSPNAMDVNTAMQRCLAKAIALHGLGLYIYAGEDLPEGATVDKGPAPNASKSVTVDAWDELDNDAQKWLQGIADQVRVELENKGAADAVKVLEEQGLSAEHKIALWSRFDSKERSAMKSAKKAA